MALSEYRDVYTVEAYEERVSNIISMADDLNKGDFFNQYKKEVEDQIEILEEKERKILNLFGVENLEELNKNIQKYRKAVFSLSGPALYQEFIGILKENNKEEFEAFSIAAKEVIIQDILKNQSYVELGKEKAHEMIMNALSKLSSKNVKVVYSSKQGYMDEDFFPNSFTGEQKIRLKQLMLEKYKDKPSVKKYFDIVNKKDSGEVISTTFTWFDFTDKMTPTLAKEILEKKQISDTNRKIKDFILSKIDEESRTIVEKVIEDILRKNPTAFFVGKNENEIAGILGEIQGMYYLSKLIKNEKILYSWIGGTHVGDGKKKPHQDLIVEDLGIQVKNTTKDALKYIGSIDFANAGINTILNKTNVSGSLGEDFKKLIENYFSTVNFNVEYHKVNNKRNGVKYLPKVRKKDKKGQIFVEKRKELLNQEAKIDRLMSLFAASLMYMDVAEKGKRIDANVLYLLGGAAIETASNILKKVLEDLKKEETRFKITSSTNTSKTIIDALNDGKRGMENYSISVKDSIKLTSSFLFT